MISCNKTINIKRNIKGKVSLLFPFLLIIIFNFTTLTTTIAQTKPDTSIYKEVHSPRKAALLSMALPGLGQIYNKQYWKVPVLYAGFATLTYFLVTNKKYADIFKTEYAHRINNETNKLDPTYTNLSTESILQLRDYNERNYEFTIIITCAVYLLNIIDASVYGHLFSFDVGTDLSLKVEPTIFNSFNTSNNLPSGGLKLSLRF